MNVTITCTDAGDITNHVINYTIQQDICSGVGTLDIVIDGTLNHDFIPWNTITVIEEGTQLGIFNVASAEKTAASGTYIIAAQDNSKRLTDYFIDTDIHSEVISYTRYWLEMVLNLAGVSYSINADGEGEPVTIGTTFGMMSAYDSVMSLLQLSGWYMYFDSNGVCQIGELEVDNAPKVTFHSSDIIKINKRYNDKNIRNRVYVWGTFDEDSQSWVTATVEAYTGWTRDDGADYRSIVYQNSSILYYSSALDMAEKILSTFSKEIPEKEMEVVGMYPTVRVGDYIASDSQYGSFLGQITTIIRNLAEEGYTTTFIVDKKCPRLFGYSDIKSEYVYIGTDNSGVWRKPLNSGYWAAYNYNIEHKNIIDLSVYNESMATVTGEGNLYINRYGSWGLYTVPSGLVDAETQFAVPMPSGMFTACSLDRTYELNPGVTAAFVAPASGSYLLSASGEILSSPDARSWIIGLDTSNSEVYMHQVNYTANNKLFYNMVVIDLETNDLGQNIISISTPGSGVYSGFSSYNHKNGSNFWVGTDLYNTIPPGNPVIPTNYGGLQYRRGLYNNANYYFNVADNHFYSEGYNYYTGAYEIVEGELIGDYDWAIFDDTIGWQHYMNKLVKVGNKKFHGVSNSIHYGYDEVYEFDTDHESVITYLSVPWASCGELRLKPDDDGWITSTYISNGAEGGNDGNYFIYSTSAYKTIADDSTEHSGCGYVRVINAVTGGINTYEINVPPRTQEGRFWTLRFIGSDETPNHVIFGYVDYIKGYGPKTEVPLYFHVHVFIINKYTGACNYTITTLTQYNENGGDEWSNGGIVSGQDSWDEEFIRQYGHRGHFFKALREDIDGGYGYALMHIPMANDIYKWLYDPFWWPCMATPHWGWHYYGTVNESFALLVTIPGGTASIFGDYRDVITGNDNVEPPIAFTSDYRTPAWLLTPSDYYDYSDDFYENDTIFATYSRDLTLCPIIVLNNRIGSTTPVTNSVMWFGDPNTQIDIAEPDNWRYAPNSNGYTHPKPMTVGSMLDCIDDLAYITAPMPAESNYESDPAIYGVSRYGTIEKTMLGAAYLGSPGSWYFYDDFTATVVGDGVICPEYNGYYRYLVGWHNSLASGEPNADRTRYKILLHDPTTVPSGTFTVLFEYNRPLYIDTGMGIPTVIFDKPASGVENATTILATSYTNSGISPFNVNYPAHRIYDARTTNIFGSFYLPSGIEMPESSVSKYITITDWDGGSLLIYGTEPGSAPTSYSTVFTVSGTTTTHLDLTNMYESPYVFVSTEDPASGTLFFQRNQNSSIFYSYSNSLPTGARITIIRADDRI